MLRTSGTVRTKVRIRVGDVSRQHLCCTVQPTTYHPLLGITDQESRHGAHPGFPADEVTANHIDDDCLICCEILDSRTRSTLYHNPTVAHEAEYVACDIHSSPSTVYFYHRLSSFRPLSRLAFSPSILIYKPSWRSPLRYVLSHMTVSKVISMVSMKREIRGVLEELLAEEVGSHIATENTKHQKQSLA